MEGEGCLGPFSDLFTLCSYLFTFFVLGCSLGSGPTCVRRLHLQRILDELLWRQAGIWLLMVVDGLVEVPGEHVAVVQEQIPPIHLNMLPHDKVRVPNVRIIRHLGHAVFVSYGLDRCDDW